MDVMKPIRDLWNVASLDWGKVRQWDTGLITMPVRGPSMAEVMHRIHD